MTNARITVARAFISFEGEDTSVHSLTAVRRGMRPECFDSFLGGTCSKDGISHLATIAWNYYEQHRSPITEDLLKAIIGRKSPKEFQILSQALGEIKAREIPSIPEIVSSVAALRDMKQLIEVKLATDSLLVRANNGEDVPALIDDVMVKIRRSRAAYSGDSRLDIPLFTSWKESVSSRSLGYITPNLQPRVPTGIQRFDESTGGGLRTGEIFLMHGRTGVGKSHLLQHIAMTIMRQGGTVVLASGEMDTSENFERFDGQAAGRDYLELSNHSGKDFVQRLKDARQLVSSVRGVLGDLIVIPPVHCRTTGEIREAMVEISRKFIPSALIVDYLTLIKPDGWSGGDDWSRHPHTASELKFIGYEFDVPVITVAQSRRDSLRRRPSDENIAFSDGIAHVVNYDFEIRLADAEMERLLDIGSDAELPVEREIVLHNVKSRRSKTGYKIPLWVNFATGEVKNLAISSMCDYSSSPEQTEDFPPVSVFGSDDDE